MPNENLKYKDFDKSKGYDKEIYNPDMDFNARINKKIRGFLGEKPYGQASEGEGSYQKKALDRRQQKNQGPSY